MAILRILQFDAWGPAMLEDSKVKHGIRSKSNRLSAFRAGFHAALPALDAMLRC